ncbi:MAG TPA: hypothetical protein PLG90_10100 [Ignavibacteria bacterium]|nr:hypothetical protein [Ignavibacteria bacterium]
MSDETKNETVNVSVNNAVLPKDEKATKLEVIITVLLGVATVLGALAAYFAALWGGNQQSSYAQSISETNHANTVYLEALNELSQFEIDELSDDVVYSEWKENLEKGDIIDAEYFFSKLSESLQKDLQENPNDLTEYEKEMIEKEKSIRARFEEADERFDSADELMKKGNEANGYGDDFTLCTVLFTVVLFFLGLASLKTKESLQKAYVGIGGFILLFTVIRMLTLPFPF